MTCLWFPHQAEEAATFYTALFKNSKITDILRNTGDVPDSPEGVVVAVGFSLEGEQFMTLNGRTESGFNPAISFIVNCRTDGEITALWDKLSAGGQVLMPLDKYPFSDKYGWVQDKYGLSWQLMLSEAEPQQKIMPSLMFTGKAAGKAEEAINFYSAQFEEARVVSIFRYGADRQPDREGTVMFADFILAGQWFAAMDSAHEHKAAFNDSISFVVNCDTQEEVDAYWKKLTEGGQEVACGWLTDRFGISWQITPRMLFKMLQSKDKEKAKRTMQAMMKMIKLDIAQLEQA
ncbi:VOC family protein [Compostibacter hankyongensis]|uniref:VOC family protein n=2 Tax=Compostibacter hankyongensis TaxID=1007089 RepID=A0ABP8FG38_9BACT